MVAFWYLGASRGEAKGYKFLAPIVEERKKRKGSYDDGRSEQKPVSASSATSECTSRI
jgi:hypothetical protein